MHPYTWTQKRPPVEGGCSPTGSLPPLSSPVITNASHFWAENVRGSWGSRPCKGPGEGFLVLGVVTQESQWCGPCPPLSVGALLLLPFILVGGIPSSRDEPSPRGNFW